MAPGDWQIEEQRLAPAEGARDTLLAREPGPQCILWGLAQVGKPVPTISIPENHAQVGKPVPTPGAAIPPYPLPGLL